MKQEYTVFAILTTLTVLGLMMLAPAVEWDVSPCTGEPVTYSEWEVETAPGEISTVEMPHMEQFTCGE